MLVHAEVQFWKHGVELFWTGPPASRKLVARDGSRTVPVNGPTGLCGLVRIDEKQKALDFVRLLTRADMRLFAQPQLEVVSSARLDAAFVLGDLKLLRVLAPYGSSGRAGIVKEAVAKELGATASVQNRHGRYYVRRVVMKKSNALRADLFRETEEVARDGGYKVVSEEKIENRYNIRFPVYM